MNAIMVSDLIAMLSDLPADMPVHIMASYDYDEIDEILICNNARYDGDHAMIYGKEVPADWR